MAGMTDADLLRQLQAEQPQRRGLTDADLLRELQAEARPAPDQGGAQGDNWTMALAGPTLGMGAVANQPGFANYTEALARAMVRGLPVVGPTVERGIEHADAWLSGRDLADVQQRGQDLRERHPYVSTGGEIAGSVAGTAPLVAAAPAAFGVTGANLAARVGAGALSGATLGAADTAARGGDPMTGALYGGAGGGAGVLAGAALGKLFASRSKELGTAGSELRKAAKSIFKQMDDLAGPDAISRGKGGRTTIIKSKVPVEHRATVTALKAEGDDLLRRSTVVGRIESILREAAPRKDPAAATRAGFERLARDQRLMASLTEEQRIAVQKVADRSTAANILEALTDLRSIIPSGLVGGATIGAGPVAGAAAGAAVGGAKLAGRALDRGATRAAAGRALGSMGVATPKAVPSLRARSVGALAGTGAGLATERERHRRDLMARAIEGR